MNIDTAIVTAIISAAVAFGIAYMSRKQKAAETDRTASEAWQGLIKPMQERINELEADYAEARKSIAALEATVRNLQATIASQNNVIRAQSGRIDVLNAYIQANYGEPPEFTVPLPKA